MLQVQGYPVAVWWVEPPFDVPAAPVASVQRASLLRHRRRQVDQDQPGHRGQAADDGRPFGHHSQQPDDCLRRPPETEDHRTVFQLLRRLGIRSRK